MSLELLVDLFSNCCCVGLWFMWLARRTWVIGSKETPQLPHLLLVSLFKLMRSFNAADESETPAGRPEDPNPWKAF